LRARPWLSICHSFWGGGSSCARCAAGAVFPGPSQNLEHVQGLSAGSRGGLPYRKQVGSNTCRFSERTFTLAHTAPPCHAEPPQKRYWPPSPNHHRTPAVADANGSSHWSFWTSPRDTRVRPREAGLESETCRGADCDGWTSALRREAGVVRLEAPRGVQLAGHMGASRVARREFWRRGEAGSLQEAVSVSQWTAGSRVRVARPVLTGTLFSPRDFFLPLLMFGIKHGVRALRGFTLWNVAVLVSCQSVWSAALAPAC
jgi:hypothetical protein